MNAFFHISKQKRDFCDSVEGFDFVLIESRFLFGLFVTKLGCDCIEINDAEDSFSGFLLKRQTWSAFSNSVVGVGWKSEINCTSGDYNKVEIQ